MPSPGIRSTKRRIQNKEAVESIKHPADIKKEKNEKEQTGTVLNLADVKLESQQQVNEDTVLHPSFIRKESKPEIDVKSQNSWDNEANGPLAESSFNQEMISNERPSS